MAVFHWFLFLLSFVWCEDNPYSFNLFENMEGTVKLFNQEKLLIEELQRYQLVLQDLHKVMSELKFHIAKDPLNPIDATYRLNTNVKIVKEKLLKRLKNMKNFQWSKLNVTLQDYKGALNGLLLLQDTYEFDISKVATDGSIEFLDHENNYQKFQSIEKLKAEDLLEIAKVARNKKLFDRAIQFMQVANRLFSKKAKKKYRKFTEELAALNNKHFLAKKVLISEERQVLPYLVKDNLEPKLVQPDWITNGEFDSINFNRRSPKAIKDRLNRVFCSRGTFLRGEVQPVPKCRLLHHFDPFLKLAPFQAEIITNQPYRSMLHNVLFNHELKWMVEYAKPYLSEARELEEAKQVFNVSKGETSKREFILKTIQTWFNDLKYFEENDTQSKLVFPHLHKLSKRLELATQLKINLKYASTEFQVTHYGLGGLCETHIDPYGYIEGAGLYDHPGVQLLKKSGDIFGTLMGYLSHVEQGGATAFSQPNKEVVLSPQKGSVAFWWSLDAKGHRLEETIHGGCPILKGSKWIFNKWVYYFDQWRRFPCGLHQKTVFKSPDGFY